MIIELGIFNKGGGGGGHLTPEQEEKLNNSVSIDKYNEDKELQAIVDKSQNDVIQDIEDNMVTSVNGMIGDVELYQTWSGSQEDYDNLPEIDENIFYCIEAQRPETPLAITALENGTVSLLKNTASAPTLNLEYSLDKKTWNVFSQDTSYSINKGETMYIRGINDRFGISAYNINKFSFSNKVELSGNIMSLLYGDDYEDQDVIKNTYCFTRLFYQCKTISSIEYLKLPAITLANNCYEAMFSGCYGLTSIPESLLPATTVKSYCYYQMFSGCYGLTSIPEKLLPATTLANRNGCYQNMFENCSGLISIPENLLPATELESSCYKSMFRSCRNLTSIPEKLLPATTISSSCYEEMFYDCTGLISIPENLLPATTLKSYCYQNMFYDCTNLKSTCILPATTLTSTATSCYSSMFRNCTSLVEAKPILATEPRTFLSYMFNGCTNLKSVTVGFTSIPSTGKISANWLNGVLSGGNINIPSTATWDATVERSANGVPAGWTITKI